MSKPASPSNDPSSVTLKVGRWLEARATGWGLVALPLILLLLGAFLLLMQVR